eukprot:m.636924 g.636924  ORF g.636924 m.636924 type:complete len:360 (+) comp22600_c0_seq7:61-1140(+)
MADKPMNDSLLRAARGEVTDRVPVWVMRQAGRYLPEFREERKKSDFFTICRTPELACKVTKQPLDRFELDAAIIFSDILVIPQALGMVVEMVPGKGPVLPEPLEDPDHLERLTKDVDVQKELGYVFDAISLTKSTIENKIPIYGFCGGPWTIMSYMTEGGGTKMFSKSKGWLYAHPAASKDLLEKITEVSIPYLVGQVRAGAQILQVFESWAGELHPEAFNTFLLPYVSRIATEVKARCEAEGLTPVPMVIFAKGAHYALEALAQTAYDVIQVDWTIDPAVARQRVGPHKTLQGNLDPCILYADDATIRSEVQKMLTGFGTQRYIANLGHGMHPSHDPAKLKVFIDSVHAVSESINASK